MSKDINVPLEKIEAALQKMDTQGKLWVDVEVDGVLVKDIRPIGGTFWFEYHCSESHDSSDAPIWYRSHQQVEVLQLTGEPAFDDTFYDRCEVAHNLLYKVRFADGLEWDVFEDELLDSPEDFCRKDPPKPLAA